MPFIGYETPAVGVIFFAVKTLESPRFSNNNNLNNSNRCYPNNRIFLLLTGTVPAIPPHSIPSGGGGGGISRRDGEILNVDIDPHFSMEQWETLFSFRQKRASVGSGSPR